jgi:hypothetical protein
VDTFSPVLPNEKQYQSWGKKSYYSETETKCLPQFKFKFNALQHHMVNKQAGSINNTSDLYLGGAWFYSSQNTILGSLVVFLALPGKQDSILKFGNIQFLPQLSSLLFHATLSVNTI